MLAVAAGMALESIADALEMSRRSLCRTFVRELAIGRSKQMLENIIRLDAAAAAGNTAAIKAMIVLINRDEKPEAVMEDKWAAVAAEIEADLDEDAGEVREDRDGIPNLPKNNEFRKNN
jgi:transcriptional regulator GlxA family with amidase domain